MRLARDDGKGWQDLGGTAEVGELPPDVRMPYKSPNPPFFLGGAEQYRGRWRKDFLACGFEAGQSELGRTPEEDQKRGQYHMPGLLHAWQAHPHASNVEWDDDEHMFVVKEWVPVDLPPVTTVDEVVKDGVRSYRHNLRRINIGEVTLPHDCANHLPE